MSHSKNKPQLHPIILPVELHRVTQPEVTTGCNNPDGVALDRLTESQNTPNTSV